MNGVRAVVVGVAVRSVGRGFVVGLGPEEAVGHGAAHAGVKAVVQRLVKVLQRLGGGVGQFTAVGQQGRQGGRQDVARAHEAGVDALVSVAEQLCLR